MATLAEHAGSKEQESFKLEITRVIKASRQRVFDSLTRPEFIRQWFGPEGGSASSVEADAHVGGDYRFEVPGMEGADVVNGIDMSRSVVFSGRYVKVQPHDLLVFTWLGNFNPAEETLVTVKLRDVEGGTEVKLTHERFQTEGSRTQHEFGWTTGLNKLGRFAEGS